jgi:hypothetical protein
VPRIKVSARDNLDKPLGQPTDWGPGGFSRFVRFMIGCCIVAALLIWLFVAKPFV